MSFWVIFCPFSPLTNQIIKILRLKKTPGDITILHICTINDNHMMYGSWDMEYNRQNFLSFWNTFCSEHYGLRKSKFWKNEKNTWKYYHFIQVYHKWQSYDIWFWDMKCEWQIFLSFWTIFCPFTPLTTWKIKTLKNWKNTPGDIIILHKRIKNNDHMLYLRYGT